MSCDAGVCIYSDEGMIMTNGTIDAPYGIMISGLLTGPGYVQCAGGNSPLVEISKIPGTDHYRVLVTCPAKSDDGPPES